MTEKHIQQFRKKLLSWFKVHQRKLPWRNTKNPYHTWVAEVMLQQTQVKKVLDYYQKFIDQFPDLHSLARANLQQILKAWEGMGYYARARNLQKAAQIIVAEKKGVIPKKYDDFKKLPGAGEYITAAVLSQAFNAPFAVVDGNVKRVISRLFLIDLPINLSSSRAIFQEHADLLLDHQKPGDFNQAMMELGATICRPKNPQCVTCPISVFCKAFKTNQQNKYPVVIKSKPIPQFHITVGIIHRNGQFLITQRKINGLLGGMWEFPGGRVKQGENVAHVCKRRIKERINLDVEIDGFLTRIDHAYTHFKIIVDAFECRFDAGTILLNGPLDYRWISASEIDNFPFHAAHHKIISLLKEKAK